MWFLANKPIQRKVTMVILLTCSAALLVAFGALLCFQVLTFRRDFTEDLSALVQITSKYAWATIPIQRKDEAAEMLKALEVKPHITGAEILLPDGTVFARYGKPVVPPGTKPGRHSWEPSREGKDLIYPERLSDPNDNELLGGLYIRSDYNREFWSLLRLYAGVVGPVLVLSFLLTWLLSSRLQRVISEPILSLAETARAVAENKDYSVRAHKLENDEIGLFTEAFNQMLAQIQHQDEELRRSQQKIETLVNSIEGVVWEADPDTLRFTFVSQHAQRLLGFPAEQWLAQPAFWQDHLHEEDRQKTLELTQKAISQKNPFTLEYRMVAADGAVLWIRSYTTVVLEQDRPSLVRGVLLDISKEKAAAEELRCLHAELVLASRQAGMAEVATGVLHNVGNVLNSVNVSASIVCDKVRKSEVSSLTRVAALLSKNRENLPEYLGTDAKGRKIPGFVISLAEHMVKEQGEVLKELDLLTRNIEHVKDIVAMQQSYARVAGVIEVIPPQALVADALRIHSVSGKSSAIQVRRDYEPVPRVAVDKHKALQILINLFTNARHAIEEAAVSAPKLDIAIRRHQQHVRISVTDNGIGIPSEHLTRIFSHGFTTKRNGHGFGLHSGALAAKEMGGALTALSDGPGTGATFVLDLPVAKEQEAT